MNQVEHITAQVAEHFEDYLIVAVKEGRVYTHWRSNTSAYGMARMVQRDIEREWKGNLPN